MRTTREDFLHRYRPRVVVTGASEGIALAARSEPSLDSPVQESDHPTRST